jgi:hypothetical protein
MGLRGDSPYAMYICIHQYAKTIMHRTQIYLPDALYDSLKVRSRSGGLSISELIRRVLERDIKKDPVADARAYFARLKPLESFAQVDSQTYVRTLRDKSRILQNSQIVADDEGEGA